MSCCRLSGGEEAVTDGKQLSPSARQDAIKLGLSCKSRERRRTDRAYRETDQFEIGKEGRENDGRERKRGEGLSSFMGC